MKTSKQMMTICSLALMIALSALAGLAWACTPQPKIVALGIEGPPARSTIEVAGEAAGVGVAQIHWNSLEGPVLAEPSVDGAFSTTVTIPDVAPGVYFLVLDSPAGVARTSLEVSASAPGSSGSNAAVSAVSTDLWQGYASQAGPGLAVNPGTDAAASPGRTAGLALSAMGAAALAGAGLTVAVRRRRHAS